MWKWLFGSVLVQKVDRLSTYAAALAYGFVLSVVPFLIVTFTLVSQIAPRLDLGEAYQDALTDILPSVTADSSDSQVNKEKSAREMMRIVSTIKNSSHPHGLAFVGIIFALYTSYSLMNQIVCTLLFIFDDPRRAHEFSPKVALKIGALFCIWTCLLLIMTTSSVLTLVIQHLFTQLHVNPDLWTGPWLIVRNLVLIFSLLAAFFFTYYLVPTKRYKFRPVRDGALIATLGWVVCGYLFSTALPNMLKLNVVYQALGSVVIVLLWAQACAWSVIGGACWIVRFSSRR